VLISSIVPHLHSRVSDFTLLESSNCIIVPHLHSRISDFTLLESTNCNLQAELRAILGIAPAIHVSRFPCELLHEMLCSRCLVVPVAFACVRASPRYDKPSTSRASRAIYKGEYVAGGEVKATPLLQAVDVNNADVDAADADNGLLIAPYQVRSSFVSRVDLQAC